METWTSASPIVGLVGLLFALLIYLAIKRHSSGSDKMIEISEDIHAGAMAFLKREYSILLLFVIIVFVLLFVGLPDARTSYAFLAGAACSIIAGFAGMKAATRATSAPPRRPTSMDRGRRSTSPSWVEP